MRAGEAQWQQALARAVGRTALAARGAAAMVSVAAVAMVARPACAAAQAQQAQQAQQARQAAVSKAVDLEQSGRWVDAIAAWRGVLAAGEVEQAALGLERVFSQLGQEDSIRVLADTLVATRPANRVLRSIQIRTLRSLGRLDDEGRAFEAWVAAAPGEAAPYQVYGNQLLMDGRAARADTILQRGVQHAGAAAFQLELAQLYVSLGRWARGAAAWREIVAAEPYMDQSALFSLGAVPAGERDSVRAALSASPMSVGARKVLGMLELLWLDAREGWRILSALSVADSAYATWADFASGAERQGAWIPAREALLRMSSVKPELSVLLRAAAASVSGGEPEAALPILAGARRLGDGTALRTRVLPLEVRALTTMGRAGEAEALVRKDGAQADEGTRQAYARQIAWGWVRAGEVEKARAALAGASADDDEEVSGWIALFEGNLVQARAGLRRPADATPDVVTAMAMLGRTRADTNADVGAAFLALARRDTAAAANGFERAAGELGGAAPLMLAFAARLWAAKKSDAAAIALWGRIVERYPKSPEAPESDLEWARTLRRKGDASGARERLEHLVISYPESALVPQARRELESLQGGAS